MTGLEQLADKLGFLPSYINCFGKEVSNSPDALKSLIEALGYDTSSDSAMKQAAREVALHDWQKLMADTIVVDVSDEYHMIEVSVRPGNETIDWICTLEDGSQQSGSIRCITLMPVASKTINGTKYLRYQLSLNSLPMGYHQLAVTTDEQFHQSNLIVTPRRCYSPEQAGVDKVWGLAAQLYSLSSDSSWGVGDFSCLKELLNEACQRGISAIGLNPLHPLYPSNPGHRSPYSPTSRCFLNTLYIDINNTPGYEQSESLKQWLATDEFKIRLAAVRDCDLIDYPGAGELKYQALRLIFDDLKDDFMTTGHEWGESFASFRAAEGDDLENLATYDALYAMFRQQDKYGWFAWPDEYHDPASDAVVKFKQTNQQDIDFYAWLQWVADQQLTAICDLIEEQKMAIGLYLDLAVGCDGGGAEVWSNQDAFLAGAAVGAPPDAMNVLGQDWGLTPINPVKLKAQAYEPLAKALRCSMKYAGALRIDHILGFMRQYWVPPGRKADEGIYIRFPMDEMFRIIALESHRNQCLVIGEDLGTVPAGFDKIMADAGLLSYKVLFFERWESGLFKRPNTYPAQSMATVSTHDLHTLAGWWSGRDLRWRGDLNLYPDKEMAEQDVASRPGDKEKLIAALIDLNLIPESVQGMADMSFDSKLAIAIQKFLAETASVIQLVPMEDILLLEEQVNIPGTIDEHPNWKRKLPVTIDEFWKQGCVSDMVAMFNEVRPLT